MIIIAEMFAQFKKVQNCPSGETNAFNPRADGNCLTNLPQVAAGQDEARIALSIVFAVAAGIALISLMIAAINYVTAFSDQDKIARSRRNIIYSLIGLIIALSAEAIVLTVVGRL